MNILNLRGILKNIRYSHSINDVDYNKADLITKRLDGKEDIITLEFKKFSNTYKEDQEVELVGNVRSYSKRGEDGKNKVQIYVFTYFDQPSTELDCNNDLIIDGTICKIDAIRQTKSGKSNIHFILANNISKDGSSVKLNSYIPCVAWGVTAKAISKLSVGDKLSFRGELHSREYKKVLDNGDIEIRVAHEALVTNILPYIED